MSYPYILIIGRLSDEDNVMAVFENASVDHAKKVFHKQLCDIWEDRSASRELIIEAVIASNEPFNVLESDTMVRAK